MLITGPWNVGEFKTRLPPGMQDRWATAPLPPPEAAHAVPGRLAGGRLEPRPLPRARVAGSGLEVAGVPLRAGAAGALLQATGDLPARRSAWKLAGPGRDPKAAAFRAQLGHVVSTPKVPEWERIATRVAESAEQVMRGGRDLDAALAGLDKDVDQMLEKRRWLLDRAGGGRAALTADPHLEERRGTVARAAGGMAAARPSPWARSCSSSPCRSSRPSFLVAHRLRHLRRRRPAQPALRRPRATTRGCCAIRCSGRRSATPSLRRGRRCR